MVENVVIVNCQVSSEAYQLLSMLRQKPFSFFKAIGQSYLFIWYNSLLSRLLSLSVVKSTQVWIFLMLLWYHRDDNSFL